MRFYLGSRRKNLKGAERIWKRRLGSGCGMVVLALLEKGQQQKAATILKQLLNQEPHRIAYLLAHAQQHKLAGNKQRVLEIYENALTLYPKNEALTLKYVEILIENKQAKKATKILSNLLRNPITTPLFYKLMAQAEGQLGNDANRHEALAEYYYNIGQVHQALTQLKLALKDKSADFYQRSRIEARKEEFKEQIIKDNH